MSQYYWRFGCPSTRVPNRSGRSRVSDISDIHVRLIGAGVICGALSRVMNPISRRAGLLDLSLIRCRSQRQALDEPARPHMAQSGWWSSKSP